VTEAKIRNLGCLLVFAGGDVRNALGHVRSVAGPSVLTSLRRLDRLLLKGICSVAARHEPELRRLDFQAHHQVLDWGTFHWMLLCNGNLQEYHHSILVHPYRVDGRLVLAPRHIDRLLLEPDLHS